MMSTFTFEYPKEPVVLVFCADDNSAMLLAVALQSAIVHLEQRCPLHLYIIDGGMSEISKDRLHRVLDFEHVQLEIEWVVPDMTILSGLETYEHLTGGAYLRLLIPDLVSECFKKAIYLDCDVQVESNLMRLWQEEVGDKALLAVQSFVTPYVSSPAGLPNYQDLGLKADTPYFNSGVLVMNLERWRTEKLGEKVIYTLRNSGEYLRQVYEQYGFSIADQYGLNAVLADDWDMLNPRWNVMSTILLCDRRGPLYVADHVCALREELLNDAFIYHFTGYKPWRLACEHPVKVRWRRYLEESGWFNPI